MGRVRCASTSTCRATARPRSLRSEGLFAPLFAPPAVRAAVADEAWLQAMLDVEAALAAVQARAGLVPARAAEAIAAACRAERFDAAALGEAAIASANP